MLESWTAVGPLARTIEDLELLFLIIARPDGIDPSIVPVELRDPLQVETKGLRIAFYSENGSAFPTKDTKATVESAAMALEKLGAEITNQCPPPAKQTPDLQKRVMFGDGQAWHHRGMFEVGSISKQELEKLLSSKKRAVDFSKSLADWNQFRSQMLEFMSDFDAIICPVQASPAPLFANAWQAGPATPTRKPIAWPCGQLLWSVAELLRMRCRLEFRWSQLRGERTFHSHSQTP